MKILLAIDRLLIVILLIILLSSAREEEEKTYTVNGSVTICLGGTDSIEVYIPE